jgi:hypothetical protein
LASQATAKGFYSPKSHPPAGWCSSWSGVSYFLSLDLFLFELPLPPEAAGGGSLFPFAALGSEATRVNLAADSPENSQLKFLHVLLIEKSAKEKGHLGVYLMGKE